MTQNQEGNKRQRRIDSNSQPTSSSRLSRSCSKRFDLDAMTSTRGLGGLGKHLRSAVSASKRTPLEECVKAATNGNATPPTREQMETIYNAILDTALRQQVLPILWRRLEGRGKEWMQVYKTLLILEYILRKPDNHSVLPSIRAHTYAIAQLEAFEFIDKRTGSNCGNQVKDAAHRIVVLLEQSDAEVVDGPSRGYINHALLLSTSTSTSSTSPTHHADDSAQQPGFVDVNTLRADHSSPAPTTSETTSTSGNHVNLEEGVGYVNRLFISNSRSQSFEEEEGEDAAIDHMWSDSFLPASDPSTPALAPGEEGQQAAVGLDDVGMADADAVTVSVRPDLNQHGHEAVFAFEDRDPNTSDASALDVSAMVDRGIINPSFASAITPPRHDRSTSQPPALHSFPLHRDDDVRQQHQHQPRTDTDTAGLYMDLPVSQRLQHGREGYAPPVGDDGAVQETHNTNSGTISGYLPLNGLSDGRTSTIGNSSHQNVCDADDGLAYHDVLGSTSNLAQSPVSRDGLLSAAREDQYLGVGGLQQTDIIQQQMAIEAEIRQRAATSQKNERLTQQELLRQLRLSTPPNARTPRPPRPSSNPSQRHHHENVSTTPSPRSQEQRHHQQQQRQQQPMPPPRRTQSTATATPPRTTPHATTASQEMQRILAEQEALRRTQEENNVMLQNMLSLRERAERQPNSSGSLSPQTRHRHVSVNSPTLRRRQQQRHAQSVSHASSRPVVAPLPTSADNRRNSNNSRNRPSTVQTVQREVRVSPLWNGDRIVTTTVTTTTHPQPPHHGHRQQGSQSRDALIEDAQLRAAIEQSRRSFAAEEEQRTLRRLSEAFMASHVHGSPRE